MASLLTIAPSTEMRYTTRLPYFREIGVQTSKLHPKKRYMYPVPSLMAETDMPDSLDRVTRTE